MPYPKKPASMKITKRFEEGLDRFEISPDAYLHKALINAIDAIPKAIEGGKNATEGMTALIVAVDQAENIAIAKKSLQEDDPEYKEAIEKKAAEVEKKFTGNDPTAVLLRLSSIANFKLRLLMSRAFDSSTKEAELTL